LPQSSPQRHPEKHTVLFQKGDEKLLLETVVMERGSPLIASSKCKKIWGAK
jgi:hypothetical protein